MQRERSFLTRSISRRDAVKGTAIAAAGAALMGQGGSLVHAQEASPASSPAAALSKVAARASGDVRATGFWSPEELKQLDKVFAAFKEQYPNINVKAEPIASDYLTKIQTDIAAGNVADIFMVQNEYAQDFMSRNVLLAIDDYMTEDGVTKDEFYKPLIDAYTWKGKLYGLPKDWSPICAVYDTATFEKVGVKPPTTWDELKTVLTKLKESEGSTQLSLDPQFARYVIFLFQAGGSIANKDVTRIELDSDAAKTALAEMYGLYKDGLSTPSADIGADWPGDAFAKDLSSIIFEGNWVFPFLATNAPAKKYGIAELPAGPAGKGTPAFTNSYSIFAGSKNPDAAWVVVNFLTGAVGAEIASELGLAVPGRPDLEAGWIKLFPDRQPYLNAGKYATPVQYGPGGQKFQQDADAVLQSLWAGQIDESAASTKIYDVATQDITLTGGQ